MSDEKQKGFALKKIVKHRLFLPLVYLAVVLIINVLRTPTFFNVSIRNGVLYGFVVDIVNRSSELVILAIGMTLITASSGGQDISVGAIMAVSAAVICQILSGGNVSTNEFQNPLILALLAGIAAAAICGAFNGFLVAKLKIQPMVATLILYTAGRGIAQLITRGQITYVRVEAFKIFGGYIPGVPIPTPIFIALIVVVSVMVLMKFTALRIYIQSVGVNAEASRLVGLNSARIKFITYVLCGVLAGIAGVVASSRIYSADANNIGLNIEMDAILAVALGGNLLSGGKFSLAGSIIGAFTIQSLTTTLYAMNVSSDQLPVYKALVVIAIVVFQSEVFRKWLQSLKTRRVRQTLPGGSTHEKEI